ALSEGGEEGQCGWVNDRYGLSWQIIPRVLPELLGGPDAEKSQRVMQAMLEMKKIEIGLLEQAAAGV
ncbi:MAG TPA: VOC family protein, partial [Gaiellaceae bacterium]